MQHWTGPDGILMLLPQIPFRTDIRFQTLYVSEDCRPIRPAEELEVQHIPAAVSSSGRAENRDFLQAFIYGRTLGHSDQPPPRHGGNNWVHLRLPWSNARLEVYREKGWGGLFVQSPEVPEAIFSIIAARAELIVQLPGLSIADCCPEERGENARSLFQPANLSDQMA